MDQVVRNVFGNVSRTDSFGVERGVLLVEGADFDTLFIVEHRAVDRSGDVIFGKFRGGANIDDFIEAAVVFDLLNASNAIFHGGYFNSGRALRQTLSSKRGCASAVGLSA